MTSNLTNILYTAKPNSDAIDAVLVQKAITEQNMDLIAKLAANVTVGSEGDKLIGNINNVEIRKIWASREREPAQVFQTLKSEKRITVWNSFVDSTLIENDSLFQAVLKANVKDDALLRILMRGTRNKELSVETREKLWVAILNKLDTAKGDFSESAYTELRYGFNYPPDATYTRLFLKDNERLATCKEENGLLWSSRVGIPYRMLWKWMLNAAAKDETFNAEESYTLLAHVSAFDVDWFRGIHGDGVHSVAVLFERMSLEHKTKLKPAFLAVLNETGSRKTRSIWTPLVNVCNDRKIDYGEPEVTSAELMQNVLNKLNACETLTEIETCFVQANRHYNMYDPEATRIYLEIYTKAWMHPSQTEDSLRDFLTDGYRYFRAVDDPVDTLLKLKKEDPTRLQVLVEYSYSTSTPIYDLITVATEQVSVETLMDVIWEDYSNHNDSHSCITLLERWMAYNGPLAVDYIPKLVKVSWLLKGPLSHQLSAEKVHIMFPGLKDAPVQTWEQILTLAPTFEGTTADLMETIALLS